MSDLIRLEGVTIGYENRGILSSLDLSVKERQFFGILGPNGGGKSTLLKTLLGLIPPVAGRVEIKPGVVFGYVPQSEKFDPIFPVSAQEIVKMGRYARVPAGRGLAKADREHVLKALEKVGLGHLERRTFRSLSGGEKQRALLARAIAGDPDILVLDEPTASVDMKGEAEIMELVEAIRRQDGTAVVMVSHFLDTVAKYADSIVLIDKERGLFRTGGKSEMLRRDILTDFLGLATLPYEDSADK